MANLRKSGEDYLEAILVLKNEKGVVHSIDVARHMEYSKPSISRAMSNLRADGYVLMAENGELTLTDSGRKVAETIYERHKILTTLLVSLGVSPATAAEDACQVEHVISAETFDAIKAHYSEHQPPAEKGKEGKKKKKKKKG